MDSLIRRFKQWLSGPGGSRGGSRMIVAAFGKHPGWADFMDDEGLIRILYHIDREMSAGLVCPVGRGGYTHSADARVPASGDHIVEASILWTDLLLSQYGQRTGVLLIIPQHESWIDIIVGEPVPTQLYCLRAPIEALPLTNTVLYKISDEFIEKVRQKTGISKARGNG